MAGLDLSKVDVATLLETARQELPKLLNRFAEFASENYVSLLAALVAVVIARVILGSLGSKKESSKKPPAEFLVASEFKPLPLHQKKYLTHNTVYLRFRLPSPQMVVGLPIGQHITFMARDADGGLFYKPYTPISNNDLQGYVDFVIKIYPEGKMSQVVKKMEVGDEMMMKGPRGMFTYTRNKWREIGMLAGGTGITPMYQVANIILRDPSDRTRISLVFGSLSRDDILLEKELDALAAAHPSRFSVYHVLNNPPDGWTQGAGFVTPDMIRQRLPPPASDVVVLSCGPPAMVEAMKKHLDGIGYAETSQFRF